MSKEKQIEEMCEVLRQNAESCKTCSWREEGLCVGNCELAEENQAVCEALYNAGYRKQSEWISVDERLPEANTQVLAINSDGEFYVATYIEHKISPSARGYMTWASGMYNGKPTHWMPLPEAPKMTRKEDEGK